MIVHPAEGVLPVGVGELPVVGRDEHFLALLQGPVQSLVCTNRAVYLPRQKGEEAGHPSSSTSPAPDARRTGLFHPDAPAGRAAPGRVCRCRRRRRPRSRVTVTGWSGLRSPAGAGGPGSAAVAPCWFLAVRPPNPQRGARQADTHPVAQVGGRPAGVDQGVGVGEPVVPRTGDHQYHRRAGDRLGGAPVPAPGKRPAGRPMGRSSPGRTGGDRSATWRHSPRAQDRCHGDAAAHPR